MRYLILALFLVGCGGDVSGSLQDDANYVWYNIQETGGADFTLTIEKNDEQIAQYSDSAPFETPKIQVFKGDRVVAQFCTEGESSFQVEMILNNQVIDELEMPIEDGEAYCRPVGHTMDDTVDAWWN